MPTQAVLGQAFLKLRIWTFKEQETVELLCSFVEASNSELRMKGAWL
jgi:hypothetical protein